MTLSLPSRALTLEPIDVNAKDLVRISRFSSGEPYFGRTAANRFDDPRRIGGRRFGTCYAGLSLASAFAETVLHDEMPEDGHFWAPPEALTSRFVVRFDDQRLKLANMTGAALKRSGASAELFTEVPYATPQQWALAVFRHREKFDGVLYVSRHAAPELAAVVFDRASTRLANPQYIALPDYPGSLRVVTDFGVLASRRTWRAV